MHASAAALAKALARLALLRSAMPALLLWMQAPALIAALAKASARRARFSRNNLAELRFHYGKDRACRFGSPCFYEKMPRRFRRAGKHKKCA
jgi:hypothetical protein